MTPPASRPIVDRYPAQVLKTRLLTGVGVVVAAVGLFFAYLRMAYAFPINSDGASNALQAWDMFHGNPLLSDWTLSDVAFYPTELIQYALIQAVHGYGPGGVPRGHHPARRPTTVSR